MKVSIHRDLLLCTPEVLRERFDGCFVGAPCSRGAFYVPYCLTYCVSPLPHGNRLVKATRLTANLGYD